MTKLSLVWYVALHASCLYGVQVELTLREHFESARPFVTLQDLADCQGEGKLCDDAYGVVLVPLLQPGQRLVLSQHQIQQRTQKEWPEGQVLVQGAPWVVIQTRTKPLDMDLLKGAIDKALVAWNEALMPRYKVALDKFQSAVQKQVFPRDYQIIVQATPDVGEAQLLQQLTAWHQGRGFPIECIDQTFPEHRFKVDLILQWRFFRHALAARTDLLPGTRVEVQHTIPHWQRVFHVWRGWDVAEPPVPFIEDLKQLLSEDVHVGPRGLAKGEPLMWRLLEKPMLVQRGQDIKLAWDTAQGGQVSTRAQALQQARKGEIIGVRLAFNKKILRARVTGPGAGEVMP